MVGSAVAFERPERPSLLACLPSKLSADVRGSSDREIVLAVANCADWPRRLVLRRPWVPGYRALLGRAEVSVSGVGRVPVRARCPAYRSGLLVVRFAPRSLRLGFLLLAVGIVGLLYGVRRSDRSRVIGT